MFKRPKYFLRRILANNQIRAAEVRVVDEKGEQLGIMSLEKALEAARERGLDLVQVTEKVTPPVCKITDQGKYLYQLEKKERAARKTKQELKGIRLKYNISPHDLEIKARQAEKFLEKGNPVRIEMQLRGREKYLRDFAKEKIDKFLELVQKNLQIKVEQELKKQPRGLTMIISKQ